MTTASINNKDLIQKSINEWVSAADTLAIYRSSIFGGGHVKELEELFCNTFNSKYAVALSSCTAALHTAMYSSGIKKNSSVLILGSKWEGIDGLVNLFGAIPIRIDKDFLIKHNRKIKNSVNNLKAVIAARNLNDGDILNSLKQYCEKNKIILIEDFADLKEIDLKNIKAPEYGQFATFSFGYDKWIQAGEGGLLLCNDFDYYVRAVQFSQHPLYQRARLSAKIKFPIKYGLNYRIHPIAACLAVSQLKSNLKI